MAESALLAPELHEDPVQRLRELWQFSERVKDEKRKASKGVRPAGTTKRAVKKEVKAEADKAIPPIPLEIIKRGMWVGVRGVPGLFKVTNTYKNKNTVGVYGGEVNQEMHRAFNADRIIPVELAEIDAHQAKKERSVEPRLKKPKTTRRVGKTEDKHTDEEFLD